MNRITNLLFRVVTKLVKAFLIDAIVSSFLYFVKRKDLIPDNIPLIGHLDDIGVAMVALKMVEPELSAYAQWRQTRKIPEEPSEN